MTPEDTEAAIRQARAEGRREGWTARESLLRLDLGLSPGTLLTAEGVKAGMFRAPEGELRPGYEWMEDHTPASPTDA